MAENFITEVDICDEAKDCFLTYAEEVLTDRAIPAAEDGLLSSQRKILWTMTDHLKMDSKGKTKKCFSLVGTTLATSYIHGDTACYGVLCKMAQEFLMRYPLIHGQGSLGTQEDNDMVASPRYTEAKPSKYADLMMIDFKKKAVPTKETYNGEYMEPVVLPSLFPNAICNGKQAIGISMAHNSLPHNLTEVCNAIIKYLEKGDITIDEIMECIPGPDFPLENIVINKDDVRAAFATGKSTTSLKVRGCYKVEDNKIIFYTIPYRTYRNKIKEQITKNIDEIEKVIDDFDDESELGQNRLVFSVKPGINPESAVEVLFAYTDLQATVSYNMNYIVNGTPKLCSMKDLIKAYVDHQTNVLINVTQFDRDKAAARKHVIEGLLTAITDIDKAIRLIRESDDKKAAVAALTKNFPIDTVQAEAILDMKLARLTKLDKDDLLKELEEKKLIIAECDKIINDKSYRDSKLIEKVTDLKKNYGDARRTTLLQLATPKSAAEKKEKEKIETPAQDVVVITTKGGYIKRIPLTSFKVSNKNTKGIKSVDETVINAIKTTTKDSMFIFTDKGKMYRINVDEIPEGTSTTKGVSVTNFIKLELSEQLMAVTSLHNNSLPKYVIFVSKNGIVKKSYLAEYLKTNRKTGIAATKIAEGDSIIKILFQDDEDIIFVTKEGQVVRVPSTEFNTTGRLTVGVKAVGLANNDYVIEALPVHHYDDNIAMISSKGYAKKMNCQEFNTSRRGARGVNVYRGTMETGLLVGAAMVDNNDNILMCADSSSIVISVRDIPLLGKLAVGNSMFKGNIVKKIAKI